MQQILVSPIFEKNIHFFYLVFIQELTLIKFYLIMVINIVDFIIQFCGLNNTYCKKDRGLKVKEQFWIT
jgi:hypothetical protein